MRSGAVIRGISRIRTGICGRWCGIQNCCRETERACMTRFKFIRDAMEEVKYPRFFHSESPSKEERKRIESLPNLPPSYVEFLNSFGRARFFRELYRDRHRLYIYPPSETLQWHRTDYMLEIGAI